MNVYKSLGFVCIGNLWPKNWKKNHTYLLSIMSISRSMESFNGCIRVLEKIRALECDRKAQSKKASFTAGRDLRPKAYEQNSVRSKVGDSLVV